MNVCLTCGKETKNPKFCNRSCSASFNNKGVRRHGKTSERLCLWCGKKIYGKKYCEGHQKEYNYHIYINKWKLGLVDGCKGNQVSIYIRRYLFEKYNYKCSRCSWNKENTITQQSPLEVEHIDGNHKNNKEENLDLICPNCHSLTTTYKNLNYGNGSKNRVNRYKLGKSF